MKKKTNLPPIARHARMTRIAPLLFAVIALIAASGLMASARAWFRPGATTVAESVASSVNTATTAQHLVAPSSSSPHKALEAEIVTIRPWGFEPAEINRPKGRFVLMVDNRSGLGDVDLRLNRQAGGSLHQVRVPREQQDWNDEFELEPGQYVLTESSHPEWSCRITITAQ